MTDTIGMVLVDGKQETSSSKGHVSASEALKLQIEKLVLRPPPGSINVVIEAPDTLSENKSYYFGIISTPCHNGGPDVIYFDWVGEEFDVLIHVNESGNGPLYLIHALFSDQNLSAKFGTDDAEVAARMTRHLLQYVTLRYVDSWKRYDDTLDEKDDHDIAMNAYYKSEGPVKSTRRILPK